MVNQGSRTGFQAHHGGGRQRSPFERGLLRLLSTAFLLVVFAPTSAAAQGRRARTATPTVRVVEESPRGEVTTAPVMLRCVPGAQVACACPGAGDGVQVCDAGGTGFETCVCATPAQVSVSDVDRSAAPTRMVETSRWYGWQVLLADVVGGTLSSAGAIANESGLVIAGGAVQIIGPPTIHWLHGRVGVGFSSLGLRVGGPLVGGLAAAGIQVAAGFNIDWIGVGLGASAGALIAAVVDVAALSHERISRPQTALRTHRRSAWERAVPGISVGAGGAAITLQGVF